MPLNPLTLKMEILSQIDAGALPGTPLRALLDADPPIDLSWLAEAVANAVVAHIVANAVVTSTVVVASVSGVTTGPGVSGPGTGTATGTIT